jgi:DNA mismatch endonuclease (patch repair protein)
VSGMTDIMAPEARSRVMSRIRSKNTKPEILVRSALFRMGARFRIHRKDLPGKPDIVLPRRRLVIFVHGCFWHRHEACSLASVPHSNLDYWNSKFAATLERDRRAFSELKDMGWTVAVIWECEAKDPNRLQFILGNILQSEANQEQADI